MESLVSNRITLFTGNFSGSNTVALYKFLKSNQNIFDVKLIIRSGNNSLEELEFIKTSRFLIYTAYDPIKYSDGQIVIQTWHGFPLKTLGVLNQNDCLRDNGIYVDSLARSDIVLSYSKTYQTFYNACFPTFASKYYITGMPRNDFLFLPFERVKENLERIFGICKSSEKFILFSPTYKLSGYRGDDYLQTSYFEYLDQIFSDEFVSFLDEINSVLFLKLHPVEKRFLESSGLIKKIFQSVMNRQRIFLIKDEDLKKNFTDLYELLPCFDLLITDYSSIAYDWLLTDKPVVNYIPDRELYKKQRNFLVEPLELWVPGAIAKNVHELQREIQNSLSDKNYQKNKRELLKRIVHHYMDSKSSERVFNLIRSIYEQIG